MILFLLFMSIFIVFFIYFRKVDIQNKYSLCYLKHLRVAITEGNNFNGFNFFGIKNLI